jgi:hypothetical protein
MYPDTITVKLKDMKLAHSAPRGARAGFRKFSKKQFMHRTHAARPLGFDSSPSKVLQERRCDLSSSAGSSKIKIWTSLACKENLALMAEEVRILIFDDPAELERS